MPWVLLNQQSAVKLMIFWVHNLRQSLGGMRHARHWKSPTNGTPNSLRATVIKDFRPGLQIRPRRFDSGFGLHIRKPRRSRSTGFFYACDLADHFRNFLDQFRNLSFSVSGWSALRGVLLSLESGHAGLPQCLYPAKSLNAVAGTTGTCPFPRALALSTRWATPSATRHCG